MKKIILVLVGMLVLLISITAAHAADNIIESPNIRVVIDGKQSTFSDVPVTVNNLTMLPLREILAKLGVPDDDRHIIWNDSEKSVTAYKDNIKIYLKVGSNTAVVNDSPVELKAVAVNYKNRVFIPLRFVSDSLGKTVVWDEATDTALIRDTAEFNKTKGILDKVTAASASVKKIRFAMDMNAVIASNSFEINGSGETDYEKGIMHMNMSAVVSEKETVTETYLASNKLYSKKSGDSEWEKKDLTKEQFDWLMNNQFIIKGRNDILAAGLVTQQDDASNGIFLKGDVFLDDILKKSTEAISIYGLEFNKMELELDIDNNSFLIKKMAVNIDAAVKAKSGTQQVTQSITCTYSDYNGNFGIDIPEGIQYKP